MKKFIWSLFTYIPLSVLFYIIIIILWGEFAPKILKTNLNYPLGGYGFLYSRLNEADTIKNVDIIFIGSSHAYRGFDTRVFKKGGIKTMNLGSSNQSHIQSNLLLKKYCSKENCKLVVYEVFPSVFTIDGVESSLDLIANSKIDSDILKIAFETRHIKVINSIIYGLYRLLLNKNLSFFEDSIKKDDTYISGGYVEKKIGFYKAFDYPKKNYVWNEKQFSFFDASLSFLKENNIKVILVQAPYTSDLYNSYLNNSFFDEKMNSYGLKYYNYNEMIDLDDSLFFYDGNHLNQNGVKFFNNHMIKILKNELH